jgi:cephalosporin hydroxylase
MRASERFKREIVDTAAMLRHARNPMEAVYYGHMDRLADKWHHYLDIYDRHLGRFRNHPVHLLEIGIYCGGSLQIWRTYLGDQAVIHGIDIMPRCASFAEDRIIPHIGDEADVAFLSRVAQQMGRIDIVIDDASHLCANQISNFETLYPLVDANGVYMCEDTHTSYWNEFQGGLRDPRSFIEYSKRLIDKLHAWYIDDDPSAQDEGFARVTQAISFYDSIVVFEKRPKDPPIRCKVGWRQF